MTPTFMKYAKAIVAVVGAVAVVLQAALSDDHIDGNEWVKIAFALLTAAGVYLVPNTGYVRPATVESVYPAEEEKLGGHRGGTWSPSDPHEPGGPTIA